MSLKTSCFVKKQGHYFETIIITGICRSGKTLLGNILSTCSEVEYIDEPYTPMMLPMVYESGKIEKSIALNWFKVSLSEIFNDLLLLRNANFRPDDLSTIWEKKNVKEIFHRLTKIHSRKDAKDYAINNKSKLLITLAETTPFAKFFEAALPNATIIHVIRNAYDVAEDVLKKKWFSNEQLLNPINSQLYTEYTYKSNKWYLPWWVEDQDFEYFLLLNEYNRCIYYWCSMMEKGVRALKESKSNQISVFYEELITNPAKEIERIVEIIKISYTGLTEEKINLIKPNLGTDSSLKKIDKILEKRMDKITKKLKRK